MRCHTSTFDILDFRSRFLRDSIFDIHYQTVGGDFVESLYTIYFRIDTADDIISAVPMNSTPD